MSSLTAATYQHIQLDDKGVPMIAGATMNVVELIMGQIAHGWSPEELHFQRPYLTLGQIHSALAYHHCRIAFRWFLNSVCPTPGNRVSWAIA